LRDSVELATKRAESSAVDGVRVRGTHDVRSCSVDGMVDHVCGSVQQSDFATVNDLAFGVDEDEIRGLDERESNAEWVHPEMGGVYRILEIVSISSYSTLVYPVDQTKRHMIALL
jgi:hypothetical protein